MLDGNLHLSSDLRRLNYIKILLWITSYRSRLNKNRIIKRYRDIIKKHRDEYDWNYSYKYDKNLSGQGMGSFKRSNERDMIADHHLSLSIDLEFLKSEVYSWSRFGYVLSSLYASDDGVCYFYDDDWLHEQYTSRGFISIMSEGEKLVYSSSLFLNDFNNILPFLKLLNQYSNRNDIEMHYLTFLRTWMENKIKEENNYYKKRQYVNFTKDIINKEERLNQELMSKNKDAIKIKPSIKLYCREQISPRLEFLLDLDIIDKKNTRFYLSDLGKSFYNNFFTDINYIKSLNENMLYDLITQIRGSHFNEIGYEEFVTIFRNVSNFYKRTSTLLLSYYNTYVALSAKALNNRLKLSLSTFDEYSSDLMKKDKITVSTSGRGTKYIKVKKI